MLRLGDKNSGSREVLVDVHASADGDVIASSSIPEVTSVSRDVEPATTTTAGVKLDAARLRSSEPVTNNNYVDFRATPGRSAIRPVPVSTNRKRHGGRGRQRISAMAQTQNTIERVELTAVHDLISVLGEQRTSRNLTYFVVLYSAVLCLLAAFRAYLRGVEYQVGRQYFLSGGQLRLITGIEVAGIVVALPLVALFGRRCHKPVLMFAGTLVCAVGCLVCPVAFFVESARAGAPLHNITAPNRNQPSSSANLPANLTSLPPSNQSRPVPDMVEYFLTELCSSREPGSLTASYNDPCDALRSTSSSTYGSVAYSAIVVGVLLHGLGSGMIATTGLIYVDENAQNKAVAVYFGVLLSMSGFGQFIGACLAWWFTSYRLYLTSSEDSLATGVVAEWEYRAWWLGFVLQSVAMCFISGLFLAYPRWIVEPDWVTSSRQRHLRRLERVLEWQKEDRRQRREQRKKLREQQRRQLDSSMPYQLANWESDEHARLPSDSSSMTSLPVTSLAGATVRQTSVAGNSVLSSVLTDETYVSWTSSSQLDKADDADSDSDADEVIVADHEDDDVGQSSRCYSNTLFSIDEEDQTVIGDSTGTGTVVDYGGTSSRSARSVQFDVNDDDHQQTSPATPRSHYTAVLTRDNKPTVLEKKLQELRTVLTTPVYTLSMLASVLSAFLVAGYHTVVARLVHLQYGYDYQHARFYTNGLCFGLAETIGPIVGGVIIHKRKWARRQQLKLIIGMLVTSSVLMLLLLPISCSDAGFVWQNTTTTRGQLADGSWRTWIESCNAKCSCSADDVAVQLEPVCIDDGRRYYSPCHAGCSQLQQTDDGRLEFSSCSCSQSSSSVYESVDCTSNCPVYGVYWIVLLLSIVSRSVTQVGIIMLFTRTFVPKRRMLSLGLAVWVIVVLAYLPGAAIYRAIETSSCLDDMTQTDCHSEPVCWRHDLDRYRYGSHGLTAAFQVVAVILFAVALRLLPDGEAADQIDDDSSLHAASTRRVTAVPIGCTAAYQQHAPVSSDVRPVTTDRDVTNIAAGRTPGRFGSVYDTRM